MPSIRRDISSSAIRRESSPPPLEVTEKREYPLSWAARARPALTREASRLS